MEIRSAPVSIDKHTQTTIISDILKNSIIIPKKLIEKQEWKSLKPSYKVVYEVLVKYNNYETAISVPTRKTIAAESGINSPKTIGDAINFLEKMKIINVIEEKINAKFKKKYYHLPYQQELLSKIGFTSSTYEHKNEKLLNLIIRKLTQLKIDAPDSIISKYKNDGKSLRIISFMCSAAFAMNRIRVDYDNILEGLTPKDFLIYNIKKDNIRKDIFGERNTSKIEEYLKKGKERKEP